MTFVLASFLLATVAAVAQMAPEVNVQASKHPNLAAAQQLCRQAWDKLSVAQKDNNFDMRDHAQKAKDLLVQVNAEIKLAAEAANKKSN